MAAKYSVSRDCAPANIGKKDEAITNIVVNTLISITMIFKIAASITYLFYPALNNYNFFRKTVTRMAALSVITGSLKDKLIFNNF